MVIIIPMIIVSETIIIVIVIIEFIAYFNFSFPSWLSNSRVIIYFNVTYNIRLQKKKDLMHLQCVVSPYGLHWEKHAEWWWRW